MTDVSASDEPGQTKENAGRPVDRPGPTGWSKVLPGLFSVAILGATLAPVVENWREKPADNFPLSYYPMFSQKRAEKYQVHYLVGIDKQGNRHLLSHKLAGSGGFNQTRRQINKVVREKRADDLCNTIATRVAREMSTPFTEMVEVRIVTGSYRFDDYFAGNTAPIKETTRAKAKVKRGDS